jgi:hypothetical protein
VSNHGVPSPLRPASQVAQPPFYRRQRHGVCCRIHRPSDTASKAAAAVGSRAPKIRTICHSCKETYGTDELDANRLASGKRVLGRDAAAADVLTRSQLSARVRMAGWRDADLKRDVPSRSFCGARLEVSRGALSSRRLDHQWRLLRPSTLVPCMASEAERFSKAIQYRH